MHHNILLLTSTIVGLLLMPKEFGTQSIEHSEKYDYRS